MAKWASSLIVGPAVMDRVLGFAFLGSTPGLHILNASEATAMFYLDTPTGFEFAAINPRVTVLLMPMCIGGHVSPGHYVLLHVNVRRKFMTLMDSCGSHQTTTLVESHVRLLTTNIWGHWSPLAFLAHHAVAQQDPGSNDCGVFVFRMVCTIAPVPPWG